MIDLKKKNQVEIPVASGFGFKSFTREQLDLIHQSALHILGKVGLKVESAEAVEIFQGSGAFVEKKDNFFIVKLPQHLVEDCLSWTPKNVTYYGI